MVGLGGFGAADCVFLSYSGMGGGGEARGGFCGATTIPSCYCSLESLLHAFHLSSLAKLGVFYTLTHFGMEKKHGVGGERKRGREARREVDAVACDMAFIPRGLEGFTLDQEGASGQLEITENINQTHRQSENLSLSSSAALL